VAKLTDRLVGITRCLADCGLHLCLVMFWDVWKQDFIRTSGTMTTTDNFLLVKDTAELLGVSANTVRAWALSGKLQEYRHPVNNYRLFKRDEVEELLEQITNPEPVNRPIRKAK
jgi:excisionase family DNA binding protein